MAHIARSKLVYQHQKKKELEYHDKLVTFARKEQHIRNNL